MITGPGHVIMDGDHMIAGQSHTEKILSPELGLLIFRPWCLLLWHENRTLHKFYCEFFVWGLVILASSVARS